ncbi:hypothetical protein FRC20_005179 [Serendipita sp. 405]|nr:hypothetical protein FRC15_003880 [Serendipita sp. 397]KAG8774536.1 hypothetical protein FRC16_005065 [Serendipita sp. 398]KAG8816127.1 hypothetical protein FRC18_001163 [Serendipita sp. 400]KAG8841169.1 hypothetical protein FRC20_005179 [Serendipita sp. 405]
MTKSFERSSAALMLLILISATVVTQAAPQLTVQPSFSPTLDEGVQTYETMPGLVTPTGIPVGPGPVILSTQTSFTETPTSSGTFSVVTNSTSVTNTATSTTTGAPSAATKALTLSSLLIPIPISLFIVFTGFQLY